MTKEAKLETLYLKVHFHCHGCQRKIKKIIYSLEGVETVLIDSESGKVTVVGFVEAKQILEKLKKAGKQAELWQNASGKSQNVAAAAGKKEKPLTASATPDAADALLKSLIQQANDSVDVGVKKSGKTVSFDLPNVERTLPSLAAETGFVASKNTIKPMASMNVVMPASSTSSWSSASMVKEYAADAEDDVTHIFSDENANNCHIM